MTSEKEFISLLIILGYTKDLDVMGEVLTDYVWAYEKDGILIIKEKTSKSEHPMYMIHSQEHFAIEFSSISSIINYVENVLLL